MNKNKQNSKMNEEEIGWTKIITNNLLYQQRSENNVIRFVHKDVWIQHYIAWFVDGQIIYNA